MHVYCARVSCYWVQFVLPGVNVIIAFYLFCMSDAHTDSVCLWKTIVVVVKHLNNCLITVLPFLD